MKNIVLGAKGCGWWWQWCWGRKKRLRIYSGRWPRSLLLQASILSFFLTLSCHFPFLLSSSFHSFPESLWGLGHLVQLVRAEGVIVPRSVCRWETFLAPQIQFDCIFAEWQYIIIMGILWDKLIFMCQPAYLTTIFIFVSMENWKFCKVLEDLQCVRHLC